MEISKSGNLLPGSAIGGRWQHKENRMTRLFMRGLLGVTLLGLDLSAAAQIYKWTDAQGKVHYTDRAGDTSAGRATEVKVPAAYATAPPAAQAQNWREQDAGFKDRQRAAASAAWRAPTPRMGNGTSSDSYRQETPQAKCGLARDILSGEAVRRNQSRTDQTDRDIATSDVKLFCH